MLGGGGARGSYQIGILKAIDEYGLKEMFSAISGVSIGALNGYFYLSTNSYQTVLDAWFYGVDNNPIEFSKRQKVKVEKVYLKMMYFMKWKKSMSIKKFLKILRQIFI